VKHLPTKTRICVVFWCEAEPQNSKLSLEKCERISVERQPSSAPTLGPL